MPDGDQQQQLGLIRRCLELVRGTSLLPTSLSRAFVGAAAAPTRQQQQPRSTTSLNCGNGDRSSGGNNNNADATTNSSNSTGPNPTTTATNGCDRGEVVPGGGTPNRKRKFPPSAQDFSFPKTDGECPIAGGTAAEDDDSGATTGGDGYGYNGTMGNELSSSKKKGTGGGGGDSAHAGKGSKTNGTSFASRNNAVSSAGKSEKHVKIQEECAPASGSDQQMTTMPLDKDEQKEEAAAAAASAGQMDASADPAAPPQSTPPPSSSTGKKKPHVTMEPSVASFERTSPSRHPSKSIREPVMITDALSDVRAKYHINPRELGHGHYGVVRKCMKRDTKEWYAIKSIRKSKVGKIEVLRREIDILKEVKHPNIIELIEIHEDVKYLHLITELCTGGELFDRIIAKTQSPEGHFSEKDAANMVRSILDAIRYCHDVKQIVHRDLKPENFLFKTKDDDAPIKIIDFGLSRHDTTNFGVMKTKVGTPYYVAPEVLKREYTKSCDIWSIGVITYILLCGYPPFYGDSDNQIFDSVRTGRFDFPSPDWDPISNAAKDFICCLLRKDPNLRLTASEALAHKWIMDKSDRGQSARVSHDSVRSTNFKKYMGMKKLKKAALVHIATHLTQTEVGELGDIFRQIDKNGDGELTLEEIDYALKHGNFSSEAQEELHILRDELCLSGEESLEWKEFLAATMDKSLALREDKLHQAFDHFKKSSQDYLQVSDLVGIFGGEAQAREVIGDVDTDGDGRISFEEFRFMMKQSSFYDDKI